MERKKKKGKMFSFSCLIYKYKAESDNVEKHSFLLGPTIQLNEKKDGFKFSYCSISFPI